MKVKSVVPMTDAELIEAVKVSGNVSGDYQNPTIQFYIDEVKAYLLSSGVDAEVIGSTLAKGCISRGVYDLWYPVAGQAKFSEVFYQRADQLRDIEVIPE